ncbi:MAG: xanthine dehydrogenase family protein molybdopterin-binding subunit [Lautropia sp.]
MKTDSAAPQQAGSGPGACEPAQAGPAGAIGRSIRRKEDERLLRGHGRYVDDHRPAGALVMELLRSPHAHARIARLDTAAASGMAGVVGILTAEDWEADGLGELPCMWAVDFDDGRPMNEITRPALARDKVCHVGDIVAAVVAASRLEALDAVEAIEVEYEPLPAVAATGRALDEDAPLVHERFGSNLCFERSSGDRAKVAAALASAAHVVELELINNRLAPSPMEPRATIGVHNADDDHYTLWTSSQNPHMVRRWLAEHSLKIPEHRIRVVSPDVGGGFGQKISHYAEEPLVLWAARRFRRPVRWNATRSDNLSEDTHARDHVTSCRMGFDADGRIVALDVDTVAAVGAYCAVFGPSIPGYFYVPLLSGMYRIPAIHGRVRGVYTNTVPTDAYRGAGRPEATYVVERLVETGARQLGLDIAEIRRRNFIRSGDFPYVSALGMRYDSGNYEGLLELLLKLSDYQGLRAFQRQARQQGRLFGLGMSGFIDSSGGSPSRIAAAMGRRAANWDNALVRVHPTGKITVFCGAHSHGQGHATTFAQIVADRIGCSTDDVDVVEGDTDRIPYGHGTFGSRSLSVVGVAIAQATEKVVDKGRRIAAHRLECSEADLRFERGNYRVPGTDLALSFGEVVRAAHHMDNYPDGLEPGLEAASFYDPPGRNVPAAMHLCAVEVDRETGFVTIRDLWAADDVGRVINPMIVEGQVHGGLAQGIGQALMESVVYDADGQLLTGSFMDYSMPRAVDLPAFKTARQETPSPDNMLGVKGAGESGTIGAPAAVVNAVIDALAPLGIHHLDMPLTPMRVWAAMRGQGRR